MTGQAKKIQKSKVKMQNYNSKFKNLLFLLSTLYFLFSSVAAEAATLYAGSGSETIYQGQTFVVDWFIDSQNEEVNTLDLQLQFTPDTLEISEASFAGTVFTLQLDEIKVSNEDGWVKVSAGAPGGLRGETLPVFRTVFKAKVEGLAKITFDESSSLLLNDGIGTPTLLTFKPITFVIQPTDVLPVVVHSPTHPNQNAWYQKRDVELEFMRDTKQEVSFSFSANGEIYPDNIAEETSGREFYEDLPDGIYYFKLNSKVNDSLWQEAGNFRVQIDTTPPEAFVPIISSDAQIFDGRPFVSFATVDKTSGISHYKVKAKIGQSFVETNSPYQLPAAFFDRTVEVAVQDNAGNIRIAIVEQEGLISVRFLLVIVPILILAMVFAFVFIVLRHRRGLVKATPTSPILKPEIMQQKNNSRAKNNNKSIDDKKV